MPFKIVETASYKKRVVKFFKKHPDLFERYAKTIRLMELDPFHPSLRLHKLKGNLCEYHSISISMRYRIVVEFVIEDEKIILINIGMHDDVY
ncbi:MAG: plasmid stabilization protein [Campylobacteraceae bacterium 4484_4]|nr:MAG: plasmid stabilization protein [Campylobacteraceae bacterium 4484_4]